ncbi:MAG: cation diffusion facilitator family transporter [Clostridia bacterium]|nr:cation diffusion facilitator family transporter [Clostridia bacterium]
MAHGGEKAIKAALLANGVIAVMKLVGAIMSGSASMLAEFKHSVADASNALFLLAGVRQARRSPDIRFQFGHGKRSFFWSFVAAMAMLSIGGAFSIYGGISKIMHPEPLEHVSLNLSIIGFSILFEIYSLYTAILGICVEGGQPTTGFKALPVAINLLGEAVPTTRFIFFEDTAALLGLLIAGGAIGLSFVTDNTVFDGIASILIGVILLAIGFYSARENMDSITGEAMDPELVLEVGDFVKTLPEVADVHRVKSMKVGPRDYLLNIIVEGNKNLTLAQVDDINLAIKLKIEEQFKEIKHTHVTMIEDNKVDDWEAYSAGLPKEEC